MEHYIAIQKDDVYKDLLTQILSHTCIYIHTVGKVYMHT